MKGIDTSAKIGALEVQQLVQGGCGAVGVYLRPDRCNQAMIDAIHAAGMKVWSVYEKGFPTTDSYFSADRGRIDGSAAAGFAASIGQPTGTDIYGAVDYDPDDSNSNGPTITGRISDYMRAFQGAIGPAGYTASVYGSGRTCRILITNSLARYGWLTQSTGFAEFQAFRPRAAIVQLPRINNNWDGDDIPDPKIGCLW